MSPYSTPLEMAMAMIPYQTTYRSPQYFSMPHFLPIESGNGADSISQTEALQPQNQRSAFALLPSTIHLNIMAHLDPPSQMTLGLTCVALHQTFHIIHGSSPGSFNPRSRPFSLFMQASVCGQYMLSWWYDDDHLRQCTDIEWERPLGELLRGERLWGSSLRECFYCGKYKPQGAFGGFKWETKMRERYNGHEYEAEVDARNEDCRRCRADAILVWFEEREYFCDWSGDILGYKRLGEKSKCAESKMIWGLMTDKEHDQLINHYEMWEDAMRKLGI